MLDKIIGRSRLRRAIAVVSNDGALDNEECLDATLTNDFDDSGNGNDLITTEPNKPRTDDNKGSASKLPARSQSQLDLPSVETSVTDEDGNGFTG
ncbi:hypothetical protein KIN20_013864 [Parelaphostrongylus tenuis]|uniref:Uncharacterized protein n=1 Tax=Parelaphostrongylus tenuis TaxID=148309 RepID=A0AAD5MV27_PARTN|nr:hypothetical protein KIN20_013864 [Parelaphostrongylus tenuis]